MRAQGNTKPFNDNNPPVPPCDDGEARLSFSPILDTIDRRRSRTLDPFSSVRRLLGENVNLRVEKWRRLCNQRRYSALIKEAAGYCSAG